jgi:mRNA interferase YafQ
MKYIIKPTNQFKKDFKKSTLIATLISIFIVILATASMLLAFSLNILKKVIDMLANDEILPDKYRDHLLIGNYKGKHECHLEPDWLLIYEYLEDKLILFLTRTGSHSDLF